MHPPSQSPRQLLASKRSSARRSHHPLSLWERAGVRASPPPRRCVQQARPVRDDERARHILSPQAKHLKSAESPVLASRAGGEAGMLTKEENELLTRVGPGTPARGSCSAVTGYR